MPSRSGYKPLYAHLYFHVLVAIGIGVMLGYFFPATAMKPFGDGFIKLIKMMIAPIIFTTVVVGIARIGDIRKVGRGRTQVAHLFRAGLDPRPGHRPGRG